MTGLQAFQKNIFKNQGKLAMFNILYNYFIFKNVLQFSKFS